MRRNCQFALLILAALFAFPLVGRAATVRGWEGTIELPTYLLGEEDPNPPFQLSNRHDVYPYTMLDDLTDRREPKTYRAIFLENEFLKATILPDLGGRVRVLPRAPHPRHGRHRLAVAPARDARPRAQAAQRSAVPTSDGRHQGRVWGWPRVR